METDESGLCAWVAHGLADRAFDAATFFQEYLLDPTGRRRGILVAYGSMCLEVSSSFPLNNADTVKELA